MVPGPVAEIIGSTFDRFREMYPFRKDRIANDRLHMSLASMHAGHRLPDRVIDTSLRIGDAIQFAGFDIALDRALSFHNRSARNPFVIAASTSASCAVNQLARQIRQSAAQMTGCRVNQGGTITPHVSVVWDRLLVPEHAIEPIKLPGREVALVHSYIGQSRYEILRRWPLPGKEPERPRQAQLF